MRYEVAGAEYHTDLAIYACHERDRERSNERKNKKLKNDLLAKRAIEALKTLKY